MFSIIVAVLFAIRIYSNFVHSLPKQCISDTGIYVCGRKAVQYSIFKCQSITLHGVSKLFKMNPKILIELACQINLLLKVIAIT